MDDGDIAIGLKIEKVVLGKRLLGGKAAERASADQGGGGETGGGELSPIQCRCHGVPLLASSIWHTQFGLLNKAPERSSPLLNAPDGT